MEKTMKDKRSVGRRRSLVCGWGVNDLEGLVMHVVDGKPKMCPYYSAWKEVLKRALKPPSLAYENCTIDYRWKHLSAFKAWLEQEGFVEGLHVDKDLLFPNNKHYGPDTCLLIPKELNWALNKDVKKGKYLKGSNFHKASQKFQAAGSANNKLVHIGLFETELEAHKAYVNFRVAVLENFKVKYSYDPRIVLGLDRHIEKMYNDLSNTIKEYNNVRTS